MRLLKIELFKLRKTRFFWILIGLVVLAFLILPLVVKIWLDYESKFNQTIGSFIPNQLPIFDFYDIWQNLTWVYSGFSILAAFIVLISITSEYSYTTIRQNIIDGMSRNEFIRSKFALIVFLSIVFTLAVFLIGLFLGFLYSPVTDLSSVFEHADMLLLYFLHLLTFLSFSLVVGLLLKRSGLAIALTIFYIYFIEPIVTAILKYKFDMPFLASSFPYSATQSIIPNPFGKYMLMEVKYAVPIPELAVCVAYLTIFVYLSFYLMRKRDLS
jgi:ABC-2 type transport system permease protein